MRSCPASPSSPGEEEELAVRRQTMIQGEKVAADIREARHHLTGDAAILPVLLSVSRRLQRRMPQAPALIEPSVKALDDAIEALEGATRAVEAALEACEFDPHELERCEERLFALRAMGRKYATPIEHLPALAQQIRRRSRRARSRTQRGRPARGRKRARAGAAYAAAASALSAAREKSARALEKAVMAELTPLKLERAEFGVDLKRDDATVSATGYDRAEFLVRTNPGSRPGPLMKVASGGELARFLLAIKVCLAERGTAPTLVFDEIDTGVGGAVADAMGQRLARLAARAQVLAVTHAPQVAARAQNHFRIVKIGGRQGRARRDRRGASRRKRTARRNRPHARRRRNHPGSARGRLEPDRKGWLTTERAALSSVSACSSRRIGPIKRRADARRPRGSRGNDMGPDDGGSASRDRRRARLSASLRENLRRRKAQQRSREDRGRPPSAPGEEAPAPVDPKR